MASSICLLETFIAIVALLVSNNPVHMLQNNPYYDVYMMLSVGIY